MRSTKSCLRRSALVYLIVSLCTLCAASNSAFGDDSGKERDVQVLDAYARPNAAADVWTVGTKAVEMTFDGRGEGFRLVSLLNRTCKPAVEYVDTKAAATPFGLITADEADNRWTLKTAAARKVASGGRPAVQLDVTLKRGDILARFHVLAFPGTSILRQWVEFENKGGQPVELKSPSAACFRLAGDQAASFKNSWMVGGGAGPHQGMLDQKPVKAPYRLRLESMGTANYVPWTALHRTAEPKDGLFVAMEYLGRWTMTADHDPGGPLTVTACVPELETVALAPGNRLEMPLITVGVFSGGLDNMAASLYDWQYEYFWDYTNQDYYARSRCCAWWFYCSQNLQEQFTARLAGLDMNTSDAMRTMGYEMLWDDAGWSSHPGDGLPPDGYGSVFIQTYEGPDFSQTQEYLQKMGMRWLIWFAGRPSNGVLDGKIGAWGDFEWRTDSVSFPNAEADKGFRTEVKRFLDAHPKSSFHTCSGGSTYSHTFDLGGRYSSFNYLSDLGRGPFLNHYFSYLEPPDRWGDMTISMASIYGNPDGSVMGMMEYLAARNGVTPKPEDMRYPKESGRGMLAAVPNAYWRHLPAEDAELARRDMELYRFFRCEGLAGRWSYTFHPAVQGDSEFYYFQRTSHNRKKACIIITHHAKHPVVVFPRGLVPELTYLVGFDSVRATTERTGADLTANGISIEDHQPGELIYLNLPNRPGSGRDRVTPQPPGQVLMRRETNIGHRGTGLYWSPGADDNWISCYEVRRDGTLLDKVAVGVYYFDHSAGWQQAREYAVRTVDGDSNASDWRTAQSIPNEPNTFAALGGHFAESGRDGWSAEATANNRDFVSMAWIPPAKNPAADYGGTPNQRGGVEGVWEGPGGSQVGRGWQLASNSECCARAWTASEVGTIRITGRAMREYYHRNQGNPLEVEILHNQRRVWPEKGSATVAVGDLTGAAHDITLNVAAGDVVRFVVGKGTDSKNDWIAWMPRIVYDGEKDTTDASSVVRILCGATTPYTDRCGNVWMSDTYFTGGKPVSTSAQIENTSPTLEDQTLYQNGREGKDFSYSIPVSTGLYSVRLKFAEPEHSWMFERPFNVDVNNRQVLADFDIVQAAKKRQRALERVFHYIVPDAEGNIVLHFTAGETPRGNANNAVVQAIEILPERKPSIRINAGSDAEFIDWNSRVWTADAGHSGGTAMQSQEPVVHASPTLHDQELYRTARSGKELCYTIAAPPGLYTVHLKFAELWLTEPGKRPMDVTINGRRVRTAWDPASAAGRTGMAADFRVDNVTPDKDGQIVVWILATGANDAILQAIEIK